MNKMNIIGVGNTATVYEWEDGKVLKLFKQGYPKDSIEREFHNAMEINNMDFLKPKAYEIILYEDQVAIVYDRVEGETLIDQVLRTNDLQKCAVHMANLHKVILQNRISNVPNYKDFLKYNIINAPLINSDKREEVLQILAQLPEGDTLCHGDFYPGNIMIADENPMVIDFMNICHGNYLYDVARTIYLIEYTPVPPEFEDKEMLLRAKKTLADLYLLQMNVTREMIKDYLSVIIVARMGECPDESSIMV